MDYTVQPNGSDDTSYLNTLIAAISAAGGGRVLFAPGATYRISGDNVYWGLILLPGVSLDGQGATLQLINNTSICLIESNAGPTTTLTSDISPGDTTIHVSNTGGFNIGMPIWYSFGEEPVDTAETNYFGFASVLGLTPTTLQLDIAASRASNIASVTNPANITITGFPKLIQNVEIKNFIISPAPGVVPEYGFNTIYARNISFSNIISTNPGVGVVYAARTDNISASRITCDSSPSTANVPGRVISAAESTNFQIDGLRARNRSGIVIYSEFHSQIRARNISVDNNSSTTMFYSNTGSQLDMEDLYISGLGAFPFWVGEGDLTVRNLTLDLSSTPTSIPALGTNIKGRLSQRFAGGAWTRQNCDAAGAPSY